MSGQSLFSVMRGKSSGTIIDEIKSRQTDELVVAVCGALGSGTSHVAEHIKNVFESYSYNAKIIKISKFLEKDLLGRGTDCSKKARAIRVEVLQNHGNELRKEFGNDILAQYVVSEISIDRNIGKDAKDVRLPEDCRRITIVDSLKHPAEAELLSMVYGRMFFLFGVLCPRDIRRERLIRGGFKEDEAVLAINKDAAEQDKHGQQLLDTIHMSDFFLRNIKNTEDSCRQTVVRYAELLLGSKNHSATIDEYAMFCAQSAALRSACLSRQVGAAIMNEHGDILATGRNDVPKYRGGLYTPEDRDSDSRCFAICDPSCASDRHKKELKDEIVNVLSGGIENYSDEMSDGIFELLGNVQRLKGLIEFSRAVHAEMDAITTAARNGNTPLRNATLYCTTYPCHHCARHILASGITKVYYIEPYEKSLAYELHGDAIEKDASKEDVESKMAILPFEGVAPRQYINLFSQRTRKNKQGSKLRVDLNQAKPVVTKFLDTHVDYEAKVVEFFKENFLDGLGKDIA